LNAPPITPPINPQATFPYDGGPQNPVPVPGAAPRAVSPNTDPQPRTIPRDGYMVSLPTQTTATVVPIMFGASQTPSTSTVPAAPAQAQNKYTYRAYGE
jgi:hypothetical protein